jgi:hypothetical protein
MRRSSLLIKQIQRATENERVGLGANDGISLEEYYQYLTDGARMLQRQIVALGSTRFRAAYIVSVSGSESYSMPTDMLHPGRVVTLEYSSTGDAADYRRLDRVSQLERYSQTGSPFQYILQGKTFLVNAYPSSGTFRLTYDQAVPTVDKRRGTVSAKTTASGALTALTLAGYTSADFDLYDALTIIDFYGNVKMRGVPYTSVNSGTGVVAIQGSSYTYPDGSTIAVGDYFALGEYASSHPLIDDHLEGILILYCVKRILIRDSSDDAVMNDAEFKALLVDALDTYADEPDVQEAPVTNHAYFDDLW